jgi:hypothetical protein
VRLQLVSKPEREPLLLGEPLAEFTTFIQIAFVRVRNSTGVV